MSNADETAALRAKAEAFMKPHTDEDERRGWLIEYMVGFGLTLLREERDKKCHAKYKPDSITFLCALPRGHRFDHANHFKQWPQTQEERASLPCLCIVSGSRDNCPQHHGQPEEPPAEKRDEPPRCKAWCGKEWPGVDGVSYWTGQGSDRADYCSDECSIAGRPLNPAEPSGNPGPLPDDVENFYRDTQFQSTALASAESPPTHTCSAAAGSLRCRACAKGLPDDRFDSFPEFKPMADAPPEVVAPDRRAEMMADTFEAGGFCQLCGEKNEDHVYACRRDAGMDPLLDTVGGSRGSAEPSASTDVATFSEARRIAHAAGAWFDADGGRCDPEHEDDGPCGEEVTHCDSCDAVTGAVESVLAERDRIKASVHIDHGSARTLADPHAPLIAAAEKIRAAAVELVSAAYADAVDVERLRQERDTLKSELSERRITPKGEAGDVPAPATTGPTAAGEPQRTGVGSDPEGSPAAPALIAAAIAASEESEAVAAIRWPSEARQLVLGRLAAQWQARSDVDMDASAEASTAASALREALNMVDDMTSALDDVLRSGIRWMEAFEQVTKGDPVCVACGERTPRDRHEHWRECPKHTARAALFVAESRIAELTAERDAAIGDRDAALAAERERVVAAIIEELRRFKSAHREFQFDEGDIRSAAAIDENHER